MSPEPRLRGFVQVARGLAWNGGWPIAVPPYLRQSMSSQMLLQLDG
ncbi:MAG: hypothetical protein LBS40_00305 [Burkholderiales bacterium]|nr:hypothetical protein [Burkholderiales bacterium]